MMLVGVILAIVVLVTGTYGFGFFNSPYISIFRIAFYFFLFFFLVTLAVGIMMPASDRGYDPTPNSRESTAQ